MRAEKLARAGLLASLGAVALVGSACSKEVKAEFPRPPASASIEPPEEAPVPVTTESTPEPTGEVAATPPEVAAPPVDDAPQTGSRRRRRRAATESPPAETAPPPPPSTQLARTEAPDPELVSKLERAELLLRAVEGRSLSHDREEQRVAARAFLTQARAALDDGDARRAVVLVDKGLILAEDVERASRP